MAERVSEASDILPETAHAFLLQVRKDKNGCTFGTVHRFYHEETACFAGLEHAFLLINDWLNGEMSPPGKMIFRTFSVGKGSGRPAKTSDAEAEFAVHKMDQESQTASLSQPETFLIRVLYRQNMSWQGEVCWQNQKSYFRSGLELMALIDSVLNRNRQRAAAGDTTA